jgi:hypothetical protein
VVLQLWIRRIAGAQNKEEVSILMTGQVAMKDTTIRTVIMVSAIIGRTRRMNMKTIDVPLPDMKRMKMSMIMTTMIRMTIRIAEEVLTGTEKRIMMKGEIIAGMKEIITGRRQTGIMIANQRGTVPATTGREGMVILNHQIQAHPDQNHMLVHHAGKRKVAEAIPEASDVTVRDIL